MTNHRMFVFDLDGVVTDPQTSTVSTDVLQHVANDLIAGNAVAFNTGRGYDWVVEHILDPLTSLAGKEHLEHLLVVSEMGGVLGTFKQGELHIELDPTLSLPTAFVQDVERLLEKQLETNDRFADYVMLEATKKTMASLVKWDHVPLDELNRVRPLITKELEQLLQKHNLSEFIIGQTTIAIDVQHREAGKHKGAKQVLAWLQAQQYSPEAFYTFGDSVSDKAMAEAFAASGTPTWFIFVGDPAHREEVRNSAYKTVVMRGGHSADTAAFLAQVDA